MPDGSLRYQSFIQSGSNAVARRAEDKIRESVSAEDYGAVGDDVADDAPAINATIEAAIAAGGGVVQLSNGKTYNLESPIVLPAGFNGVTLDGNGATLSRGANMPTNVGVLDVQGAQSVEFRNLTLEGNVLTPQGIEYGTFSDPMDPQLTINTSCWLHPGSTDISFRNVTIQHTGGYAIVSDTRSGPNNQRILVSGCNFLNNRPNLFGTSSSGLIYGSYTGGILYKANCLAAGDSSVTIGLTVVDCRFERGTGNQVWGHCNGYQNFHSSIVVSNNVFVDIGLDAIEIACTVGAVVSGNTGRRIGYICLDDTSQSTPRYLAAANATFLDHSGFTQGINLTNNTCTSVCGGFCSLDGFSFGCASNNTFTQPQPGDPYYDEDQIALVPAGVVYGFDCANTYNDVGGISTQGGAGNAIVGNTLYGCSAGSIIAIAIRDSKIADNDIWQPGDSTFMPILLGNQSTTANQRCYSNSITGNRIRWSPATVQAAIVEFTNWSGSPIVWSAGDANWVEGNHIFDSTNKAFEFNKAPTTSSITSVRLATNVNTPTAAGWLSLNRTTLADGTGGYLSLDNSAAVESFRFYDLGVVAMANQGSAPPSHAGFGCLYADSSNLYFSPDGGAWFKISTSGSAIAAGSDKEVQYNKAGVLGADTNLQWDYTNATLTVGHVGSSSGIISPIFSGNVAFGGNTFENSDGSFFVTASGVGNFQSAVANTVFNSKADVHASPSTTAAFQTSTGTMIIFGSGDSEFQSVVANTLSATAVTGSMTSPIFNANVTGLGGSDKTFQNSDGSFSIDYQGNGAFQSVSSNYFALAGQISAPTSPSAGTAELYYDTSVGALRYNLGGAGWINLTNGLPSGIDAMVVSGGNLTPDLSTAKWCHTATVTGNVTLKAPSGGSAGETFIVDLQQDGAGGHTITLDASYYARISSIVPTTLAGTALTILFQINAANTAATALFVSNGLN